MIQVQTKMKVADNSGAKIIQCIRVLGGYRRRYARVGDIITGLLEQKKKFLGMMEHILDLMKMLVL